MTTIDAVSVLNLILFIVPGYLVLYFICIFTDYIHEKDQFDRIVQYLLFSSVAYAVTFIVSLILSSIILLITTFCNITSFDSIYGFLQNIQFTDIKAYFIVFTLATIFASPFLGIFLGRKYFGKGFPHKHFQGKTKKKYSPSIYSYFRNKFKKGSWITCHMKDGTAIMGKFHYYDNDEEKRDYVFALKECKRYFPESNTEINLDSDKHLLINTKETKFIEIKK